MALQALSVFVFASGEGPTLSILVESGDVTVATFSLDPTNHMVLQSQQVKSSSSPPRLPSEEWSRSVRSYHGDGNNYSDVSKESIKLGSAHAAGFLVCS